MAKNHHTQSQLGLLTSVQNEWLLLYYLHNQCYLFFQVRDIYSSRFGLPTFIQRRWFTTCIIVSSFLFPIPYLSKMFCYFTIPSVVTLVCYDRLHIIYLYLSLYWYWLPYHGFQHFACDIGASSYICLRFQGASYMLH